MDKSLRILLTAALILIIGGVFFMLELNKSNSMRLVFCDVGQGDGFVVFGNGNRQIVFDSGLGNKMADCLGDYLPFWDREIEVMVLTHPQRDHMEGQLEVLRRYQVNNIVWTGASASGALFDQWKIDAQKEGGRVYEAARGDKIDMGGIKIEVLWPTKSFMDLWKLAPGSDLNETSLVTRVDLGEICAYFTGDITIAKFVALINRECQILKIAHHGSRNGTNKQVLDLVSPQLAIIQAGRNNSYGHPHIEILSILTVAGIPVVRNDLDGVIEVGISGSSLVLKKKLAN